MQIKTECPTCKNIYEVDSQYEGFEVECEGCHTSFTVVRKQTQVSTIPKKHRSLPSSGKIQKLLAEGEKVGFFDDSQYEKLHTITYHTESSVYLLIATIIRLGMDVIGMILMFGTQCPTIMYVILAVDGLWLFSFIFFVVRHKGRRVIYQRK